MITTFLLATVLQLSTLSLEDKPLPLKSENAESASNPNSVTLPPIEVSSERQKIALLTKSSLSTLTADEIRTEAPKHPNEIFDRIPGVWISSGSGQEHLTAIRSPVLTGAGACGAFMVLEDEIPTRPS